MNESLMALEQREGHDDIIFGWIMGIFTSNSFSEQFNS